ncbi:SRPBCC family protein [Microbulbifer sp. OS29]|uniref:SRPBCC family protein n=1 Tax=Microbulbifer okhotskensis TaxID=2926617 RepID=A0A9X2J929_9GAMM|nr:SRPBCC family protein [Microbulbifer okhotskensis]MCO1336196.1 SRPBCC family protein [Microbulbifer okhotskensis]
MNKIITTRLIDADIDTVWKQIADVTLIENWHPGVETTDQLSNRPNGVGATRRCNFYDGSEAVEEVVEFDESYRMKINIREFKAPMKQFESTWQLKKTPSGSTQVIVTTVYEMKLSILGHLLNILVIRGRMPKLLDKVLAGLEHHITKGEVVRRDFVVAA